MHEMARRAVAAGTLAAGVLAGAGGSAQAAVGPAPSLFQPGVISGPANDGAPTFSPDGRTLLFERGNGKWNFLLEAHRSGARWSTPAIAPFAGPWSDQQPAFSPDGRFLVYVSPRPQMRAGARVGVAHLFRVERTAKGWSTPAALPPEVNISDRVFKPSVAANGDLYFMADVGPGGKAAPKWRLFRAAFEGGAYRKAEPMPLAGDSDNDVDPAIAPDQSYLVFSSQGRKPMDDGHEHLFIAFRQGGGWSAPAPLRYDGDDWGADDGEANIGPDGATLYFTSGRQPPPSKTRTLGEMRAAFRRMAVWDNSNANVWTLPLAPYLAARAPTPGG